MEKKSKKINLIFGFIATMMLIWSCENKQDNFAGTPYDPNKPIEISGFEPDSGGLATKVFITGSNFGTDASKIKVYFGDMLAPPVIGSDGNHIYVLTPRQPGDSTLISVEVNGKKTTFQKKKYAYHIMYVVRTIAGRKGTTAFKPGTLSTAEFEFPSCLTMDNAGNLFIAHWRHPYSFLRLNEKQNIVEALEPGSDTNTMYAFGAPTCDDNGIVSAISDNGRQYFSFDPLEAWMPRQHSILQPAPPGVPFVFSTAHSLAAQPGTGYLFTRFYANGHLIKIDPVTREGTLVAQTATSSDSYLVFDPTDPNILYIAYYSLNYIGKVDLRTMEQSVFAGQNTGGGWKDGPVKDAEFRGPSQLIVAPNGNLYVADRGNHCIRMITLDGKGGGIVSTVIGKGGVPGYQDGNPEDALFDNPRGVAVTPEGDIYIADYNNNVVRKLTIE